MYNDIGSSQEVVRQIGLAPGVMDSFNTSIWRCRCLCRRMKISELLVIPFLLCSCETWRLNIYLKRGSILGAIDFLIYINDIVNTSTKSKFIMYADHRTLPLKNKNVDSLHTNIIFELSNVKQWINSNKLNLNITETNNIIIFLFQNRFVKIFINPVLLDEIKKYKIFCNQY